MVIYILCMCCCFIAVFAKAWKPHKPVSWDKSTPGVTETCRVHNDVHCCVTSMYYSNTTHTLWHILRGVSLMNGQFRPSVCYIFSIYCPESTADLRTLVFTAVYYGLCSRLWLGLHHKLVLNDMLTRHIRLSLKLKHVLLQALINLQSRFFCLFSNLFSEAHKLNQWLMSPQGLNVTHKHRTASHIMWSFKGILRSTHKCLCYFLSFEIIIYFME